jgi:DNA-binding MarR family transcriptional regulator
MERERNLQDRRAVTVSLTEAGRQLISEVLPVHIAALVKEYRRGIPRVSGARRLRADADVVVARSR